MLCSPGLSTARPLPFSSLNGSVVTAQSPSLTGSVTEESCILSCQQPRQMAEGSTFSSACKFRYLPRPRSLSPGLSLNSGPWDAREPSGVDGAVVGSSSDTDLQSSDREKKPVR
ncbi:photoreceptor disk component PRCD isoform X1 [Peromyscus maniculatus bairdii]|uniref:photoreceptor disk component PRCD isoform X1 n=1 Tax=Peromyscus maniculatus bairdii TaxID=230844 RepID=UPI003FCFA55F